jgi:hypothetical protein
MQSRWFILILLLGNPYQIWAHEGHGIIRGDNFSHYLMESPHIIWILIGITSIVIYTRLLIIKKMSRKRYSGNA